MSDKVARKPIKTSFAIPYTQFDWGDYYADTDYLTFEEHGVYWNLLRRYYTTGPFDKDLKDLKRRMRCPMEEDTKLLTILEEFFYIAEDYCWHHKRCDEEIMRVKGISEVQSHRARKGAAIKRRDANGKFVSGELLQATAGLSPAIKEEELRSNNKYKEVITKEEIQRLINQDEEQELRKAMRAKYEEEYKDETNEDIRERYITQDIEGDVRQWRLDKARVRFGMKTA